MLKFVAEMHKRLYRLDEVVAAVAASRTIIPRPNVSIGSLLYDSRKIADKEHGLFFALEGRRDGHTYIHDAYAKGVRNFVVADDRINPAVFPDANFIVVASPLAAMQQLAAFHRSQFSYPVIAITGSNGKTIVKEWLFQLLAPEYRIIRSPKSYNSQLGVALSLWEMDDAYNLAIIEAGISQVGEMEALQQMIQPTIAVLTNIGRAHDIGFPSEQAKIAEKLRLLATAAQVIYHPAYTKDVAVVTTGTPFTWGAEGTTLQVFHQEQLAGRKCRIHAYYQHEKISISIPFTDGAARENAICCWAVLLAMGYPQPLIANRMALLQHVEMRLEMKRGINHCSVIDDSYSNDLSSLTIALDFLKQQRQHSAYTVILSDIPGNSDSEEEVYIRVAKLLDNNKINRLISVGTAFIRYREKFSFLEHLPFPDLDSLQAAIPSLAFRDEAILLKGARKFGFERISRLLTAKSHETTFEINLKALEHNLNQYRSSLPENVKLMAMVKAFSYGSGSFEIANLLQFSQVDYLAVAYVDEGVELRRAGIHLPIMVMSPSAASFEAMLAHHLEPELFSFSILDDFLYFLKDRGVKNYPIHIKLDTGMHRLGFSVTEAEQLIDRLLDTDAIKVTSVFSHLAAAGDPEHDEFTLSQLRRFDRFSSRLEQALGYRFIHHIANTAGIRRWPQAQQDMVRLGIGLYGIGSPDQPSLLQQVGTLKTTITQLRKVPAGESVGYGRRGVVKEDSTIATVKIGYADGYDRRFGNGVGYMTVRGTAVPTIGDICMDMCMLDVSGVTVEEGDEVVVFGDVAALARAIGTIPYELLAGISQRVKRVYYYE